MNNINLWFAKNNLGEIVTINKIDEKYEGKYFCPLCGSEVIPKAIDSKKVSPHFAHANKSECAGESMIHYWVKNELVKKDEVFEIITNKSSQVMCKNIEFEKIYDTPYGKYKPDATITTYSDEIIFVEINYSNKKNKDEYLDKWKYFNSTVLEFSIKNIYSELDNKITISNSFKSIYYKDMIFTINKSSNEYIKYKNTIESKIKDSVIKDLKKIEWFIDDIYRYNINAITLEELEESFMAIGKNDTLTDIYKANTRCNNSLKDIILKRDRCILDLLDYLNEKEIKYSAKRFYGDDNIFICWSDERLINDRLFSDKHLTIYFEHIDTIKVEFTPYNYKDIICNIKNAIDGEYVIANKVNVIKSFCSELDWHNFKVKYYADNNKYTFNFNEYNFTIKNNIISEGKIKLRHINEFNNMDEFCSIMNPILNVISDDEFILLNENILNIYNKLKKTYNHLTFKRFRTEIYDSTIFIYSYDNECVSKYKYSGNEDYSDVINHISEDVRKYLYYKSEE